MLRLLRNLASGRPASVWPSKAARREIDRFLHHVHALAGQQTSVRRSRFPGPHFQRRFQLCRAQPPTRRNPDRKRRA